MAIDITIENELEMREIIRLRDPLYTVSKRDKYSMVAYEVLFKHYFYSQGKHFDVRDILDNWDELYLEDVAIELGVSESQSNKRYAIVCKHLITKYKYVHWTAIGTFLCGKL
jgi:hypothetical protein